MNEPKRYGLWSWSVSKDRRWAELVCDDEGLVVRCNDDDAAAWIVEALNALAADSGVGGVQSK